ncbi:hypothetical protein Pst134EA_001128 [Puccinia striiformis f. sp. tritici]|uniref:hypothetical protein n=1 Tax=Puccinia striiformis f. sp. tritici TaxID=168172 RepID=UPI0020084CE6|nr:hypothetical protein Pst134EA_001128 [Puccinia striiformis f. sp. tritici]KAH9474079.1 hypothetical protein Pst134EA_001128 [Puccinia striiformis f. sp. tritici]KAI9631529.1 hypothetical protein KEM48_014278 [Puccinia striiformis f. sp. tritici PST-130]
MPRQGERYTPRNISEALAPAGSSNSTQPAPLPSSLKLFWQGSSQSPFRSPLPSSQGLYIPGRPIPTVESNPDIPSNTDLIILITTKTQKNTSHRERRVSNTAPNRNL